MKIGIITIQDNHNYGNRLQNFAVSQLMRDYGIEADTVIIKNKEDHFAQKQSEKGFKYFVKKLLPIHLLDLCSIFEGRIFGDRLNNAREREFRNFNKRYIKTKTYCVNQYKQLCQNKQLQEYDYFLTGSDQVWNPDWAGQDIYFLTFVPPEKRIAFIASLGVKELSEEQQVRYAMLLAQMKYISVREESAAELISYLTGIEADCFFDPVLLVEQKRWIAMAESVSFETPFGYILSFFLGKEPTEEIKRFADRKETEVIHLDQKEYPQYYSLNPAQLLYLIRNARYILTDSFHVTAFSIIFQKQFSVFRRKQERMENMFSRMETLLGRLGLMGRIQETSLIEIIDDISEEQYRNIAQMLTKERQRLDKTMKRILKI